MKTTELIKKLEDLGYIVENDNNRIDVYEKQMTLYKSRITNNRDLTFGIYPYYNSVKVEEVKGSLICVIYEDKVFYMSSNFAGMEHLSYTEAKFLIDLSYEYIKTPVEERVEKKKYILIHDYIKNAKGNVLMLVKPKNHNDDYDYYDYTNCDDYRLKHLLYDNKYYKVQFTEDELKQLKINLKSKLTDYEMIEVEDGFEYIVESMK